MTFATVMRKTQLATKTRSEIDAMLALMPDPIARLKRNDLYANGLKSPYLSQALIHLRRTLEDMQAALSDGDWVTGGQFGIVDIALVAYIDRLGTVGV